MLYNFCGFSFFHLSNIFVSRLDTCVYVSKNFPLLFFLLLPVVDHYHNNGIIQKKKTNNNDKRTGFDVFFLFTVRFPLPRFPKPVSSPHTCVRCGRFRCHCQRQRRRSRSCCNDGSPDGCNTAAFLPRCRWPRVLRRSRSALGWVNVFGFYRVCEWRTGDGNRKDGDGRLRLEFTISKNGTFEKRMARWRIPGIDRFILNYN